MEEIQKTRTRSSDLQSRDENMTFDSNGGSRGVDENAANAIDINNLGEMNAYANALKLHKQKISAMVENMIETVDNECGEGYTENVCVREKTSEDKPSEIEHGVPLTVKPVTVHDVSHIVINTFRDYLCRELPGNKRNLYNSPEFKKHLSVIEDIRRAEKDVMEVQERLLRKYDKGRGGGVRLKPWNVENYSLLCPQMFATKNADAESENGNDEQEISAPVVYGIHAELRQLRLRLNEARPRLEVVQCRKPEIVRKHPVADKPKEIGLFVNTKIVCFKRCVPGGVYKKTITITNKGKRMTQFELFTNGDGAFEYEYTPRQPLASGLSSKIAVTFKCKSFENVYELLAVKSSRGDENNKLNVLVYVEHAPPVLQYTTPCFEMDFYPKQPFNQRPSSACVFECNACLVGASKTITVTTRNVGRSGKFVCVSEDVWYAESLEDVEWNGTTSMGAFTIEPSIFEINHGQSIDLKVTFEPRLQSFYCSRFIIMSDNFCANEVNAFGDGQMFGNDWKFEGQDLVQQLDAGPRSYVLDMGNIGEVVRYVYAKNTSYIKYPYRWIINHTNVDPRLKNAKVYFNIHPSTGWLDKVSETMFRVECSVTDEMVTKQLTGVYRVTASLLIDDVPKESISDQNTFLEVTRQGESSADCNSVFTSSPELFSIRVAEIEVISEYKGKERVSLRVDPVILDLNHYKLQVGSCVTETVDFINSGSCPVHVSWIPNEDGNATGAVVSSASVSVKTESFVVTDRATVHVLVRPLRGGRFRRALRFRAQNRDGNVLEMAVYVRGNVETAPEVHVRPTVAPVCDVVFAGMPRSYNVDFRVNSAQPFHVQRHLYGFDAALGAFWLPASDVKTFGPFGSGTAANDNNPVTTMLRLPSPIVTEAIDMISCQLTEWSFAGSKTVYTQAMTYVRPPDVRLNTEVITIEASLYRGVPHSRRGIRLLNKMHCDFAYSWGAPVGLDANDMHCVLEPANGTVNGQESVEFELIITPRTTGHLREYWIPCFVQCDALTPRQLRIECTVKEFSATVTYVDECDEQRTVEWHEKKNQWILNSGFDEADEMENADYFESEENATPMTKSMNDFGEENSQENTEPEDRRPAKWPFVKRQGDDDDTPRLPRSPSVERFERVSDHHERPVMAFKNIECNAAVEQRVTVRNNAEIRCRVRSRVCSDDLNSTSDGTRDAATAEGCVEFASPGRKCCCRIWIERNDESLSGNEDLEVSVWVLATTWGWYEDIVSIVLQAGSDILPAVRIPIVVQAVTTPIEFPLAKNVRQPTVKFSLYSMDSEYRLQILNTSEIPIQVAWRIYNKSEQNRPFGVVFDTLTPDPPNRWSFRISQFYGLESPRYFKVEQNVLKLGPNELGFVTFYLDRTTEGTVDRDENNMVYGRAVGTVTALEPSEECRTRRDGFKLRPAVVELSSETRHSIRPNMELRELDTSFQVSAKQMYSSRASCHTETRLFTALNLLRYPATVSFEVDSPFTIEGLRTARCGDCPGNAKIRVFYEDLLEIRINVRVDARNVPTPVKPEEMTFRKFTAVGRLLAHCENSYFEPQIVAQFKLQVYFPMLKLSTEYINFGKVFVGDAKSTDVMLSSYPGPEQFFATSGDEVFTISPEHGTVVLRKATRLTISFRPKAVKHYENIIEIATAIPMDGIYLILSGSGFK